MTESDNMWQVLILLKGGGGGGGSRRKGKDRAIISNEGNT